MRLHHVRQQEVRERGSVPLLDALLPDGGDEGRPSAKHEHDIHPVARRECFERVKAGFVEVAQILRRYQHDAGVRRIQCGEILDEAVGVSAGQGICQHNVPKIARVFPLRRIDDPPRRERCARLAEPVLQVGAACLVQADVNDIAGHLIGRPLLADFISVGREVSMRQGGKPPPGPSRGYAMRTMLRGTAFAVALGFAPMVAQAGCLTGAVVGGVAGHYAGHHALVGAAAGCAIAHHRAVMKHREEAAAAAAARSAPPPPPPGAAPPH